MFDDYTVLRIRHFIRYNRTFILSLGLVFILVCTVAYILIKKGGSPITFEKPLPAGSATYNQVLDAFKHGNYTQAQSLLREALQKNPQDDALQKLNTLVKEPLTLQVRLHYYQGRRHYKSTTEITPSLVLTPSDPYYLTVSASRMCYLYIFQVDSSGKVDVIYPNRQYSSGDNPIAPGQLRIPDGFRWFILDEIRGIETLYILATPVENRILSGQDPSQIVEYLRRLNTAWDLPGVVFNVYEFTHG